MVPVRKKFNGWINRKVHEGVSIKWDSLKDGRSQTSAKGVGGGGDRRDKIGRRMRKYFTLQATVNEEGKRSLIIDFVNAVGQSVEEDEEKGKQIGGQTVLSSISH